MENNVLKGCYAFHHTMMECYDNNNSKEDVVDRAQQEYYPRKVQYGRFESYTQEISRDAALVKLSRIDSGMKHVPPEWD